MTRQPRIRSNKQKWYEYSVVCICTVGARRTNETRLFTVIRVRGGTSRDEIFRQARLKMRRDPRYSAYRCLAVARATHQRMNWDCRLVGTVIESPESEIPF